MTIRQVLQGVEGWRRICSLLGIASRRHSGWVRGWLWSPLEFVFQEQSYSSLHSGRSLAWDHVCGDIDDPCGVIADFCGAIADFCGAIADFCGVIADFCGVIADPFGVVAIPEAIGGRAVADATTPIVTRVAKHQKTLLNIVKHHETNVKHCDT